nr:copper-transporting ATPase PAA1, chloroplastic-like isoform X1 [Lolium perenne]
MLGCDLSIGMSYGGCTASIKRILEIEPQVQSATVNLATETAVVWAVLEDTSVKDWKLQLDEKLASQLTTYGYKSSHRGAGASASGWEAGVAADVRGGGGELRRLHSRVQGALLRLSSTRGIRQAP